MSAHSHHRRATHRPETEYDRAWKTARRQRRLARDAGEPTMHARICAPEAWAAMTDEERRGYDGGWRSAP